MAWTSYTDADTWEPFRSIAHVEAAGAMLARLHQAGADFEPMTAQPQAGFVVQLGPLDRPPVAGRGRARTRAPRRGRLPRRP